MKSLGRREEDRATKSKEEVRAMKVRVLLAALLAMMLVAGVSGGLATAQTAIGTGPPPPPTTEIVGWDVSFIGTVTTDEAQRPDSNFFFC